MNCSKQQSLPFDRNSNLLSHSEITRRVSDKQQQILAFIRDEKWTMVEQVRRLVGVKSRQSAHKTLTQLEAKGLVRRFSFNLAHARSITVWGSTNHGIQSSFESTDEVVDLRPFEPSKLRATQIAHHLDLQDARIRSVSAGWRDWQRGRLNAKDLKNPDAIVTRPDNFKIAIEVERSFKSLRRYPQILVSHLRARKSEHWQEIYYLCPNEQFRSRLQHIYQSIESVTLNGKRIPITPDHLAPFNFFTYDDKWELKHKEEIK